MLSAVAALVPALLFPAGVPGLPCPRTRLGQRAGAAAMNSEWIESTVFFEKPMSGKFLPPLSGDGFLLASDEAVLTHANIIYEQLRVQAASMSRSPMTSGLADRTVLAHTTLGGVVAAVLADKLRVVVPVGSEEIVAYEHELLKLLAMPRLVRCLVCDLYKIVSVDPASDGMLQPLLFFKGFHALCLHRVAHALWARNGPADRFAALRLQSVGAELFSVDIHPAAQVLVKYIYVDIERSRERDK